MKDYHELILGTTQKGMSFAGFAYTCVVEYFAGEAFRVLVGMLQQGASPPDVEKGGDAHEVAEPHNKNTAHHGRCWHICRSI